MLPGPYAGVREILIRWMDEMCSTSGFHVCKPPKVSPLLSSPPSDLLLTQADTWLLSHVLCLPLRALSQRVCHILITFSPRTVWPPAHCVPPLWPALRPPTSWPSKVPALTTSWCFPHLPICENLSTHGSLNSTELLPAFLSTLFDTSFLRAHDAQNARQGAF